MAQGSPFLNLVHGNLAARGADRREAENKKQLQDYLLEQEAQKSQGRAMAFQPTPEMVEAQNTPRLGNLAEYAGAIQEDDNFTPVGPGMDMQERQGIPDIAPIAQEAGMEQRRGLQDYLSEQPAATRAGYYGAQADILSTPQSLSFEDKEKIRQANRKEIADINAKAKVEAYGQLKPVGDSLIGAMVDGQHAVSIAGGIRDSIENAVSTGVLGPVEGLRAKNPFDEDAKKFDADMRRAAQLIGKFMEGGVLRKEDEIKYRQMLPNANDLPEVARYKQQQVEMMLKDRMNILERTLELQGRNPGGAGSPFLPGDDGDPLPSPEDY